MSSVLWCVIKGRAAAPPANGLHHRRFDFDVAARIEKAPQLADNLRAPQENFSRAVIGDQVQIALPVADLHVGQAVPFFRQRQQRLAQQGQFRDPHGEFAGPGSKQVPGNADEIAQIEQLKQFERPRAHDVELHVNLQSLARAGDVRKPGLAVQAERQDASGHAHGRLGRFQRRGVGRGILFDQLRRGRRPFEFVGIRLMPASFDLGKLLLTLKILVLRLKR